MRHALLALLVLPLCAHALTPSELQSERAAGRLKEVYLSGSSSLRLHVAAFMQNRCTPPTFDVYFSGTGENASGGNHRAYACRLGAPVGSWAVGTPILLVKRDLGGSFQGIQPIANAAPIDFMRVDTTCGPTGRPTPALDIEVPGYFCPDTMARVPDGGLTDVEPERLQQAVNLPAPFEPAPLQGVTTLLFGQVVHGVAVNNTLYRALQESQGLIARGAAQDDDPAKRPVLSTRFVASALSGHLSGSSADKRGWNLVVDALADPRAVDKQVNVCRRSIGAGIQAAAQLHFLNAGCVPPGTSASHMPVGQTVGTLNSLPVPSPALQAMGTLAWHMNVHTEEAEACLGRMVEELSGGAYGMALIARENNPLPRAGRADKGYRFVKLDRTAPTLETAQDGRYPLVFTSYLNFRNTGDEVSRFLSSMRSMAVSPVLLDAYDPDIQHGQLTHPLQYTGPYADLWDPAYRKFASRVDRNTLADCSPLRLVK